MRQAVVLLIVFILLASGCISSGNTVTTTSPTVPKVSRIGSTSHSTVSTTKEQKLNIQLKVEKILGPYSVNLSGRTFAFEVLDIKVSMNMSGRLTVMYNDSSVLTDIPALLKPGDNVFTVYYPHKKSYEWSLEFQVNGIPVKTLTVELKKPQKKVLVPYWVEYSYLSGVYSIVIKSNVGKITYTGSFFEDFLKENGGILLRLKRSSKVEVLNLSSNVSVLPMPNIAIVVTKNVSLQNLIEYLKKAMLKKIPPWEVSGLREGVYEVLLPSSPYIDTLEVLDQVSVTSFYALNLYPKARYLVYIVRTSEGMGVLIVPVRQEKYFSKLLEMIKLGEVGIHYPPFAFFLQNVSQKANFLMFSAGRVVRTQNCTLLGKAGRSVYQLLVNEKTAGVFVDIPNVPKNLVGRMRPFIMPFTYLPLYGEPAGTILIFKELASQPVGIL